MSVAGPLAEAESPRAAELAVPRARAVRGGGRGVVLRPRGVARDRRRQPPRVPRSRCCTARAGSARARCCALGASRPARGGPPQRREDGVPELGRRAFAAWSARRSARRAERCDPRRRRAVAPRSHDDSPEGALAEVVAAWSERIRGAALPRPRPVRGALPLPRPTPVPARVRRGAGCGDAAPRHRRRTSSISIREDALAKLDRFEGRVPGLLDNLLRIEHLDHEAAREAIEMPLEHWNRLRGAGRGGRRSSPLSSRTCSPRSRREGSRRRQRVQRVAGSRRRRRDRGAVPPARAEPALGRRGGPGSSVLRLDDAPAARRRRTIVRTHLDDVIETLSRRDRDVAARALPVPRHAVGDEDRAPSADLAELRRRRRETGSSRCSRTLAGEARILRPVGDGAYEIYHDVLAAADSRLAARYEQERSQGALARAIVLGAAAAITRSSWSPTSVRFSTWEAETVDARFSIRGARAPRDVAVVSIDEKTFDELAPLAVPAEPPRPRDRPSEPHGARAIVYDIQFTRADEFKKTTRSSGPFAGRGTLPSRRQRSTSPATPRSSVEIRSRGTPRTAGQCDSRGEFRRCNSANALGYLRRSQPQHGTAGREAGELGTRRSRGCHGRRIRPAELHGSTEIDYAGPPGTIPTFSFSDVLRNRGPTSRLPRQDRDRGDDGPKPARPPPDAGRRTHVRRRDRGQRRPYRASKLPAPSANGA